MTSDLIPALDPFPIPGPSWLFHVLLVFTFFLHLLFLNLTLGGTIMAAVAQWSAQGRAGDHRAVLARRLMGINAYGISLTITTGVAPLLFVQVLYQQFFYTATILIAWVWLSLLLLLMAGYYAVYIYKFRSPSTARSGGAGWLTLAAALFACVAMIQVAVNLTHSQPGKWPQLAESGWSVLADSAYVPRFLHFLLAGLALSGVVVAWWAARRAKGEGEPELERRLAAYGWRWALWATVLQVVVGLWLLVALPREVLVGLMQGGGATLGPLGLSIVLAVGLLVMLSRVADPIASFGTVTGTLAAMVLVTAVMAVTRHQVRALYLVPSTAGLAPPAAPQWGNFALFALLLVVGLAVVYAMIRRVLESPASGEEAA